MKKIALTSSAEDRNLYIRSRYIKYAVNTAARMGIEVMPVILPIVSGKNLIAEYAREFDGYIFTGGGDVDPARYGEEIHEKCGSIEQKRDEFELHLLYELISLNRPVFGICRGCQVMNVALGGTLWQDFSSMIPLRDPHVLRTENGDPYHKVKASGFLRDLAATDEIVTNSYHHQSVKTPGDGLHICGTGIDGIAEAIEHESLSFYRAVQWHPEIDPDDISFKLLQSFFEAL